MSSFRQAAGVIAGAVLVTSPFALASAGSPANAATSFCSPPAAFTGTTITWTGGAGTTNWQTATNWSPHTVPDKAGAVGAYKAQFVCIGKSSKGKAAHVTITGRSRYLAGVDIGDGAQVTVNAGAGLYLGAAAGDPTIPSYLRAHSGLHLVAGVLGGNAAINVSGLLRASGATPKGHKAAATMTGGKTTIRAGGTLRVDGTAYGRLDIGGKRAIDNSGTLLIAGSGAIAMNNGTTLIDEKGSALKFTGVGGIYQGAKNGSQPLAKVTQAGRVTKTGSSLTILSVPVTFVGKPPITVKGDGISFFGPVAPTATVTRGAHYGAGGCTLVNAFCKGVEATPRDPETVTLLPSTESSAPKQVKIGASLVTGAKTPKHTIGKPIDVTAPFVKHNTHSMHVTFSFDASTKGVNAHTKVTVYHGGTAKKDILTVCHVHPLTATNHSCIVSVAIPTGGDKAARGDLTVTIISLRPAGRWIVK